MWDAAAGGSRDLRPYDHFWPAERSRLHDAIHDTGHKHTVRETGEEETTAILVPEPVVFQRLDVYRDRVPGRVFVLVHVGQVSEEQK